MSIRDKFKEELNDAKLSQKGKAVKDAVVSALSDFCKQNNEFAQAVEQSDKSITDCIEFTVAKAGNAISDLDVYKKAVEFYFPGATVKCQLTVDLGDGGFSNEKSVLSLDDLLDF